jgi:Skp family chaperone for outer membrane proteins
LETARVYEKEVIQMRSTIVVGSVVVLALVCLAGGAVAQDIKIGYIDSERIFNEYGATREAQDQFDRDVEAWRKEAEQNERDLQLMREELESQRLLLSEKALQDKQMALQTKASEYERFVQSIWGPTGKIAQRNAELTKPIIEKIRLVLDKLGAEQGFSIIFDAADGNIVYGEQSWCERDSGTAAATGGHISQ